MERIKRGVAAKSRYKISAMIELAKSECAARPEDFDCDPFLVNGENGTLDLRTDALRQHNAVDRLTKIAPVSCSPTATCPRWLAFLRRIFDGKERSNGADGTLNAGHHRRRRRSCTPDLDVRRAVAIDRVAAE